MGWFDFLKKKKEPQRTENAETPMNQGNEGENSKSSSKSGLRLNQDAAVSMQKEITLLQVLDMIYDSPLRLVMQKRGQAEVTKILGTFLDSRLAAKDYWSQPGKEIVPAIMDLFHEGDQYAMQRGFKKSPQNMSMLINIAILGGLAGIMILLFVIVPDIATTFLLVIVCVLCFLPNLIKRWVNTKIMKFQEANASDFVRLNTTRLEIIHDMAQYLITDIREALMNAGNDVSLIRFRLWNSDYKDIKVLDAKLVPGMSKSMYDVRFLKEDEDANAPETLSDRDPDVDFDIEPATQDPSAGDFDNDASDIDDDANDDQ
ncbi:MAG TPA: hypothetical protein VKM55_18730 [Candidatus Lokiarchaeia archaeon]|nr:hypothetical protein [Candidatus Lokiarchaeia archaeon]